MILVLLILVAFVSGVAIVDIAGTPKTSFAPGDVVKIWFDKPGIYRVKIVDLQTGVTLLEKDFNIQVPGSYELWATTPQTAEGTYRIYISTGEVVEIKLARPLHPFLTLAVAIAATAVASALYLVWRRVHQPRISYTIRPTLLLPNGMRIELGDTNVFGRETFLKLGIPPDIAKYISRAHFAIKRHPDGYYIEDLGSKNGTYLNGMPIKGLRPQKLKEGDIINVGKVLELKFVK